jgi:DNA-binding MarR family transcriptional regulator
VDAVGVEIDAEFRWAPGWDQPVEEWSIPRLFGAASRMMTVVASRSADRHGLSAAGFVLLRTLLVEDGLSSGEVARRCWITPATITAVVDTLERDGHVQRRRDGDDRRVVRLHLTEKGRLAASHTQEQISADIGRLYEFGDPSEEAVIRAFLLRLVQRLSAAMQGDLW